MKKTLLIALICCNLKAFGQGMIYLADGNNVLVKITEITKDSVKYKNLANPTEPVFSYSVDKIRLAFNAAGNYLIFSPPFSFTNIARDKFNAETAKPRPVDIVVDRSGKLSVLAIAFETETEISDGKEVKLNKNSLAFLIRKNGSHELFCSVETALPYLIKYQTKIDSLIATAPLTLQLAPNFEPGYFVDNYIPPDMTLVAKKAFEKIQTFNDYLQAINSKEIDGSSMDRFIDNERTNLFLNHGRDTRIEVLNLKTKGKKILRVREYLNQLIAKAGHFDRVTVDCADVYYATKFRKGDDGNYYATVTFSQKIQCFADGHVVYGNKTKQNIEFALPPVGGPEAEGLSGWMVFLDNIGVVETEK